MDLKPKGGGGRNWKKCGPLYYTLWSLWPKEGSSDPPPPPPDTHPHGYGPVFVCSISCKIYVFVCSNRKPCIARRLPYTMSLPVPRVAPNPPRGNMMNYDTYFLNTIPRKPLSFTIHQEWISEVLHAKRVELQKRHGMDYNFKEYAFLY